MFVKLIGILHNMIKLITPKHQTAESIYTRTSQAQQFTYPTYSSKLVRPLTEVNNKIKKMKQQ